MDEIDSLEITKNFTELTYFLPWEYRLKSDSDYFNSLTSDGVYFNIENQPLFGSVHLAIGAMHIIFMGIIYNYLILLSKAVPSDFNNTLIGFHDTIKKEIVNELAWHDFSLVGESPILDFFRVIGMTKSEIGQLKKLVKNRNSLMHANGVYIKDIKSFKDCSEEYLKCAELINKKCFDCIKKLYFDFIVSITIDLNDDSEAENYISQYFSKEYNISARSFDLLAEIPTTDYPQNNNKELIYNGLQRYLSNNWKVDL